jgi:hypothetical protein
MTPHGKVHSLYLQFPQPRTFHEDIEANISSGGHVFDTRDFFIMGRPVVKDHPQVTNSWHRFDSPDCWFVQAAAIAEGVSQDIFLTVIPYPLMWVAFGRNDGPLRYYNFSRLCEMLTRSKTRS